MYETLKNIAKTILPSSFLKKNEALLRKMVARKYSGNKYHCNVCDFHLSQFVTLENGQWLCPNCGSLPRTRRLKSLLQQEDLESPKFLHFSPPKTLANYLKQQAGDNYTTTDFAGEFEADEHYDITNIDQKSDSYDIIICYHVLEHIENDETAMKELFRILKPNGKCFVQTPFKDGEIYEDNSIQTAEDRLAHFGQEDHVRIYSVAGLQRRLESVGFVVEPLHFVADQENRLGFKREENVLVLHKQDKP